MKKMAKTIVVQLFTPGDLRCVDIEKPRIENVEGVISKQEEKRF
jgi:hypothetical protein